MSEEFRILYPEHIAFLTNAIEAAHICGIESIIVGADAIRGIDAGHSVSIVHATDIELPFKRLSTGRVEALKRTLDMAADMDDLMVNVIVGEQDSVNKIVFTGYTHDGTRTLFHHRCAHPAQVKAPGSFNDECTAPIKFPNGIYKFLVRADKESKLEIVSDADGMELDRSTGPNPQAFG